MDEWRFQNGRWEFGPVVRGYIRGVRAYVAEMDGYMVEMDRTFGWKVYDPDMAGYRQTCREAIVAAETAMGLIG